MPLITDHEAMHIAPTPAPPIQRNPDMHFGFCATCQRDIYLHDMQRVDEAIRYFDVLEAYRCPACNQVLLPF